MSKSVLNKTPRKKSNEIYTGPAANGNTYKSFIDNGERFMICRNSIENGNFWQGYLCGNWVKVANDTASVLCYRCTGKLVPFVEKIKKPKSDKPRGWAFMAEYVHKDGTVYFKGEEQPELKGTMEPTKIKPVKKVKKLTKREKSVKREALLLEMNKLKKELKKETRKTYKDKIRSKVNKIQKQITKL